MNDARGKAEHTMQDRMAEITKGLPLPPGMKLF
jgi:DNA-binding protein YbaB